MPYKNKEYVKEYSIKNKDKIHAYGKEYRKNNKERIKERNKKFYEEHPERLEAKKEYNKVYKETHKKERAEYGKEYRKTHKDKIKKDRENKYEKIWNLVCNHYSNGTMQCACCGESNSEFLTIDHINGRKHITDKLLKKLTGQKLYVWLIENNFPEGYRILCYNCNCSVGFFGYCPHKKGDFL